MSLRVGWAANVVPAVFGEAYPKFAQIAQQALNTQNHVSTECSELETCAVLGASADDPGFVELDNWKALAVDNVTASCVPCAPYALALLEFAVKFGGGQGSPMISFMDAVAKQFQCNATLGRGFWACVTNMSNSKHPLEQFPLMRVALLLTNLTGNRVEDIPHYSTRALRCKYFGMNLVKDTLFVIGNLLFGKFRKK